MKDLKPFIQAYIKHWNSFIDREEYKWKASRFFKENFNEELSISQRTLEALAKCGNLLVSSKYYPLGMLNEVAKEKHNETDRLLANLFDESVLIKKRISSFITEFDNIVKTMAGEGYSDWGTRDNNLQSFQDAHAVSVYLAMRYPNRYYIYKYGVFKTFASIIDYPRQEADKVDRLIEFYGLCDRVKKELIKEDGFITHYKKWLMQNEYTDANYNMLTQDFIYSVSRYLNNDAYVKADKKKSISKYTPEEIKTDEFPEIGKIVKQAFKGIKGVDYAQKDELYRSLGLLGEEWAITWEKERLAKLGIKHKVIHTSVEEGDGKGYDIESIEDDGVTPRYIEVKTTTGGVGQPFFYTDNEIQFSELNKEHYYIYRVFNFKSATKQAELTIIYGSLLYLKGKPVLYKAIVKK